jgi:hypothetical protein
MHQILEDYKTIYQYEAIGKMQRKKQYQSTIEWLQTEYSDVPDPQELLAFITENDNLKLVKQFYDRLLFPQIRLSKAEYDVDALLMVFQKKVVEYYEEYLHYELSVLELENIILEKYGNSKIILEYRYERQMRWLEYSIHEVPMGVLNGVNGASIEDICEMKKDLVEFGKLCSSLNIDKHEKIQFIYDIYDAYEQYLANRNMYLSFKQYLETNSIKYS